ncbi:polyadenylate-binding protein-interacting protein 1 [Brachionichthys hirsutus]|uniref:polyadenylate-binding protein-interacting protein 1 n=1 Tax=Brachionichthys hirsutus TaxID=412623 RepID=UPI003604AF8C
MEENFDRAPGSGRSKSLPAYSGFGDVTWADDNTTVVFNPREPLRQPRTSLPLNQTNTSDAKTGDFARESKSPQSADSTSAFASRRLNEVDSIVKSSNLSASAPEFVPAAANQNEDLSQNCDSSSCYEEPTLADTVTEFLGHLSCSPGSFESDINYISGVIDTWVTTEEQLRELVELIYSQSTAIPNFSYTGARLCNYLSHHLTISPPGGNFRQLLLKRCQIEFEQRDVAVRGDAETQKKLHCFVLFLGELYLNLEVKSAKGLPNRADVLLSALNELMNSLFNHPVDGNLICAVKLLKLTGSVLDDTWKESGKAHMEQLIRRIETILLDATCSRDVREMLLKLVELRSSDWGRVHDAAAASNATPDNDPNYFMNEPTFYTEDGTPFTAADPEYAEKYEEILVKQDYFSDAPGENGSEVYDDSEDEMGPEIEEAFESFCLEKEMNQKQ